MILPYPGCLIQPDSIIPSGTQAWDRYAFVNNNPVRYNDPTGHIARRSDHRNQIRSNRMAEAEAAAAAAEADMVYILQTYYWVDLIAIDSAFTFDQISMIFDAVMALANAMGGSDNFKENIGGINIYGLSGEHMGGNKGLTSAHIMFINQDNMDSWTIVHELAHAWDANFGWKLSKGMENASGGPTNWIKSRFEECPSATLPGCNSAGYYYGGRPPKGADGNFNRYEDFAESVATYVLGVDQSFIKTQYRNNPEFYYTDFTTNPRYDYINGLMTGL